MGERAIDVAKIAHIYRAHPEVLALVEAVKAAQAVAEQSFLHQSPRRFAALKEALAPFGPTAGNQ